MYPHPKFFIETFLAQTDFKICKNEFAVKECSDRGLTFLLFSIILSCRQRRRYSMNGVKILSSERIAGIRAFKNTVQNRNFVAVR
jgi:hypothetical protein